jgi:hypothetical protein
VRRLALPVVIPVLVCVAAWGGTASAISPRNPYRSFNLSGINYGSMQWERAQREGRRVWPYYDAPAPSRGAPVMSVGGFGPGGGVVRSAAPQPRRVYRRWRR